MKGFFGKFIPQAAVAVAILAATVTTGSVALASSGVTIMTPATGSEDLVIDGTRVGSFPVYNGTAQLMFSWNRYWAPYWPTYPNPQHTDKSYKVAIWQNTTPLAATPTWVELHTSHHWIDDPNPTRFTFDTFLDTENLCENCPSMIVVQPETIQNVVDANGDSQITYVPATAPSSAGVPALMKSDLFLIKGHVRLQDEKNPPCTLPPNMQWACGLF